MNINSPALLGSLRALGVLVLVTILQYIGDATHISFINNPTVEGIIAMLALAFEHQIQAKTGSALFGAIKKK